MPEQLHIRRAVVGDEDLILTLLQELAEYERLTAHVRLTREIIARDFVGSDGPVFCDLAFVGEEPAGLATWLWIYGTFAASRGLYLEDLYVREKWRGHGFGKAIMAHLAQTAVKSHATQIKWAVLNWNKPSIGFYQGLGAKPEDAWTVYELSGGALKGLAET